MPHQYVFHPTLLIWHYVNLHGEYILTQGIDQLEILFDIDKILAFKVV